MWIYDVEVPLSGSDQWLAVCRCWDAESVGVVVAALARHSTGQPIRVNPLPAPERPGRESESPPAGFP